MSEQTHLSQGSERRPADLSRLHQRFLRLRHDGDAGRPARVGGAAHLDDEPHLRRAGGRDGADLSGGLYVEIAVTTFVINIRYMLMSLSLSQKVDEAMTTLQRWVLSFGVTDEIFAVAMQQKGSINARYFSGLILTPYCGWALGTFLGAAATGILPESLRSALGIAIYGMFLAIIIPPSRTSKPIRRVVIFAGVLSCLFTWTPGLNRLSSGWVIIVCAVAASALAALRYPVAKEAQT